LILLLLLASLASAQGVSTGPVESASLDISDRLTLQNLSLAVRELQSGRPTITGIPYYQNGIRLPNGVLVSSPSTGGGGSFSLGVATFTYLTDLTFTTPNNSSVMTTCIPGSTIAWTADGDPYVVELQATVWQNAGAIALVAGYLVNGQFPNAKQNPGKGLVSSEAAANTARPLGFNDQITPSAGATSVCLIIHSATSFGYVVTFNTFSGIDATSVWQVKR
jgi:hypothetical protein